jgi:hypothetical protein
MMKLLSIYLEMLICCWKWFRAGFFAEYTATELVYPDIIVFNEFLTPVMDDKDPDAMFSNNIVKLYISSSKWPTF